MTSPSVADIKRATCWHFGISADELVHKSRKHYYSHPRHVAMYVARYRTGRSLNEIAILFGGFDHTSVIHAIKRVEQARATDPDTSYAIWAVDMNARSIAQRRARGALQ